MTILVTRPAQDASATVAALGARGYRSLVAPVLRFEALPVPHEREAAIDAVIVTSSNALRALAQPGDLHALPLFAVGDRTAQAARDAGFANVVSADGDAAALRKLLVKKLPAGATLLYLAGADLARDLAGELGARGFTVITQTVYRMAPVPNLPDAAAAALAAASVAAVLHYSRRSARAFFAAAGATGVEVSALAVPHLCLSDQVAAVARDAGAGRVIAAPTPNEDALLDALDRAIGAPTR